MYVCHWQAGLRGVWERGRACLRVPGRAAGVAEGGDVVGLGRLGLLAVLPPRLLHLGDGVEGETAGLGALPDLVGGVPRLDDGLERGALLGHLHHVVHLQRGDQHHGDAGLVHDELDGLCGGRLSAPQPESALARCTHLGPQRVVERHRDDAPRVAGLLRDGPLGAILQVVGDHAELRGEAVRTRRTRGPAPRPGCGCAEWAATHPILVGLHHSEVLEAGTEVLNPLPDLAVRLPHVVAEGAVLVLDAPAEARAVLRQADPVPAERALGGGDPEGKKGLPVWQRT